MPTHFDAIIIGAGQAGPSLAGRLTQAGRKVAMIERKLFGGTCVNTGCIPTKTLVASAYVAHKARTAKAYGVSIEGSVSVDMKAVKARKEEVLLKSRNSVEGWLRKMQNCTVYDGHAHFESPHEIRVGDELLSADQIFLNVGGRAVVPNLPGVDQVPYLTNVSMLELDALPRHLVIVGGSYIGIEFGQMYRRFGSEVTIIEKGPRLVSMKTKMSPRTSRKSSKQRASAFASTPSASALRRILKASLPASTARDRSDSVGSHVLLAVGRRPNTDDLGLEKAGIKHDERGYIKVDDQLRTNVPGIWARGRLQRKGAFTHTSYNDYEIVAANILDNDPRRVSDRIPAYALYCDPPLGRDRPHRSGSTQIRKTCPDRHSAHDQGWPRRRKGRKPRLHEDPRRRRNEADSRSLNPRNRRR